MGKASSAKKVARASRTGGGRAAGARTGPLGFYGVLAGIVVLGAVLVVASLDRAPSSGGVPPRAGADHWHQAYGVYNCDRYLPPLGGVADPVGIHTHGDGLIHTHPFVDSAGGVNATLSRFFESENLEVTDTKIELADGTKLEEGDECKGKKATVRTLVFQGPADTTPREISDPGSLRLQENQIIAFVFAPEGADVPPPPSINALSAPSDVTAQQPPGQQPPGQQPPGQQPPTSGAPPGSAPPGSAPPGSSPPSSAPPEGTGSTATTVP